ncbi:hypothetical protein EMIHUDRAFT_211069 [Emiliania huxleyi CCMP1516]|uniref:Zinc finger C3HC4 RING-type domain-containing protein n=2 Tax=Emiliania huxleyi TaxID=2903 RepID=A0A0D3IXN9_EMIH1|nr:hypothetical protein EMIHUDRAFT_211069 [Emiliania huxleyi CCMP1516]EOD16024.1 hypothetical protein EMIHUDRAFT_211069 [Emiliania huxleyi CCMP1516]|eukprot:XP_005768453.1 hypothetical protein EMIHUDRAFT_211069 [Emiliania huxleyi CCMP1516]
MTSAQAIAAAVEEGLVLHTGGGGSGFFANLGCFWSAEAAALCYARSPEGWAAAEAKRAEPIDADSHPVATACRHIYCRKCIVDWMLDQQASLEADF